MHKDPKRQLTRTISCKQSSRPLGNNPLGNMLKLRVAVNSTVNLLVEISRRSVGVKSKAKSVQRVSRPWSDYELIPPRR